MNRFEKRKVQAVIVQSDDRRCERWDIAAAEGTASKKFLVMNGQGERRLQKLVGHVLIIETIDNGRILLSREIFSVVIKEEGYKQHVQAGSGIEK